MHFNKKCKNVVLEIEIKYNYQGLIINKIYDKNDIKINQNNINILFLSISL